MNGQNQNLLSQLKDIKPIVEVHSNSLYIFTSLVAIVVLILLFIAYKYFTRIKKTKLPTKEEIALQRLKNLDFTDTKNVVYSFSVDGYLFLDDKNKDQFKKIEQELEQFKYKKDVANISNELEEKIKKFIKGLKNVK